MVGCGRGLLLNKSDKTGNIVFGGCSRMNVNLSCRLVEMILDVGERVEGMGMVMYFAL